MNYVNLFNVEEVTLVMKSSVQLSDLVSGITGITAAVKVHDHPAMLEKQTVFNLAKCSSDCSKLLLQLQVYFE